MVRGLVDQLNDPRDPVGNTLWEMESNIAKYREKRNEDIVRVQWRVLFFLAGALLAFIILRMATHHTPTPHLDEGSLLVPLNHLIFLCGSMARIDIDAVFKARRDLAYALSIGFIFCIVLYSLAWMPVFIFAAVPVLYMVIRGHRVFPMAPGFPLPTTIMCCVCIMFALAWGAQRAWCVAEVDLDTGRQWLLGIVSIAMAVISAMCAVWAHRQAIKRGENATMAFFVLMGVNQIFMGLEHLLGLALCHRATTTLDFLKSGNGTVTAPWMSWGSGWKYSGHRQYACAVRMQHFSCDSATNLVSAALYILTPPLLWYGRNAVWGLFVAAVTRKRRLEDGAFIGEALLGGLSTADDLLEFALMRLRHVPLRAITAAHFGNTDLAHADAERLSSPCQPTEVDFFITHCWQDYPHRKIEVLAKVRREFLNEHGREPMVWFDGLCIVGDYVANDLVYLPIFIMASRQILVLCGELYLTELRCVWELYVATAINPSLDHVVFLRCIASSTSALCIANQLNTFEIGSLQFASEPDNTTQNSHELPSLAPSHDVQRHVPDVVTLRDERIRNVIDAGGA